MDRARRFERRISRSASGEKGTTSGWNGASCRGEFAADGSVAFGRGRASGRPDPGSTRQSDSRVVRSRSTMRTRPSAREGRPCELATVRVKPKKPLGNPVWLRKNTGRAPDAPVRTPIPAPRSRDFVRALPVVRVRGSCESIAMPRFGHPPVRSRSSLSGRLDSVRSPHFAETAKPRRGRRIGSVDRRKSAESTEDDEHRQRNDPTPARGSLDRAIEGARGAGPRSPGSPGRGVPWGAKRRQSV